MAQLMPLPLTVSCFSKIQIGFTFLVPADPGSPGKGPLNGCVCVCVCVSVFELAVQFLLQEDEGVQQTLRGAQLKQALLAENGEMNFKRC